MNYLDIILAVLVLISFVLGYKDGFVRKLIGLAGLILAISLAFMLSSGLGKFLKPVFKGELELSTTLSGILIFFCVIFASALLKRIIHPFDRVNGFVNQIFGGIAGVIQIIFFLSGFLLFLNILGLPSDKDKQKSILYSRVYNAIPATADFFIGDRGNDKNKNIVIDWFKKIVVDRDSTDLPEKKPQ